MRLKSHRLQTPVLTLTPMYKLESEWCVILCIFSSPAFTILNPVCSVHKNFHATNMSSVSYMSLAFYAQFAPCHPLIASSKLKPDMVLEDVESDNEGQQKCDGQAKAAVASTSLTPPPPTPDQQQEDPQQKQMNSLRSQMSSTNTQPEPIENGIKMCQEDAETQTGRWTPFIESIKREAEDVALATMEER